MQLSFPDVLTALDQLATTTSSDYHRAALIEAMEAVRYRNTLDAALERHHREHRHVTTAVKTSAAEAGAWSNDEDSLLRIEFESGMTLDAIAVRHGRDPYQVAQRLHKPLGLVTAYAVDEIKAARIRHRPKENAPAVQPALSVAAETVEAPQATPAPIQAAPAAIVTPVAQIPAPAEIVEAVVVQPAIPAEPAQTVTSATVSPTTTEQSAPTVVEASTTSKPTLTAEEEKAVNSVLTKYAAKNAPQATLRTYIESSRFASKLRPEVLDWLRAELNRLG